MSTPTPPTSPLTPQERYVAALAALPVRQRRFVVEYLACLNATRAAIRAGYSERSARSEASRMLTNVNIQAAVAAGLDLQAMPASEVLARMTRIARSTIADVLRLPLTGKDVAGDKPIDPSGWSLDLSKAQATGAIDLVRRIKDGEYGPEVELYSAYDALVKLGEHYKLWGKGSDILKLIDLAKLSDAQLDRLAEGEDPYKVLLG